MNTNVVKKWASCINSVVYGPGGEDGYALREEGFNENYGCLQPNVIRNSPTTSSFLENSSRISVAVLHGIGRFDDPEVVEALEKTCGCCGYFQRS